MKKSRLVAGQTFGLVAWLESTRVELPLKAVECRFHVTGNVASVDLDQIYHQDAGEPLDFIYTFPLPAGAAVYRCEVSINGRIIRAIVETEESARAMFLAHRARGQRAVLVEMERKNLFTLTLGNLQPEDLIVVRFAWFQVLERAGDGLRLRVPTCPGVRYIPGRPLLRASSGTGVAPDTDRVPDASRISPPRIDALHPDAAYFSVNGSLSAGDIESGSLTSPSHCVCVREEPTALKVELASRGSVPDRDFVLAWREPKARALVSQGWRWTEGKEAYALVQLRAAVTVAVAEGFPQDFYFLVDRSSSMSGAKWNATCAALRQFVRLLGPQDRVWITLFESSYQDFSEKPLPAPDVFADAGFRAMKLLGVAGGTELLPAAAHVLQQAAKHSADRHASVVLITDGQVGDEDAIYRCFQGAPSLRLHAFGIDSAVNDAFLTTLAAQQGGGCWLQTPDDDIAGMITALGDRLRRPVLTDLAADGLWEPGRSRWPDLCAREVVTIALRGPAADALELSGRLSDGREHRFAVALEPTENEAVKLLWARERIASLLARDRPQEAIALARKHNLVCAGAAFIAWDEAEKVPIAHATCIQPSLEFVEFFEKSPTASWSDAPNFFLESPESIRDQREWTPQNVFLRLLRGLDAPSEKIEGLVAWTELDDEQSDARRDALTQAANQLSMIVPKAPPELLNILRPQLLQAIEGSPEDLLKWIDEMATFVIQVSDARDLLSEAQVPPEVIDQLILWTVEGDRFRFDRGVELHRFASAFIQAPLLARDQKQCLRDFLEGIVGRETMAYVAASRWQPSLGDHAQNQDQSPTRANPYAEI